MSGWNTDGRDEKFGAGFDDDIDKLGELTVGVVGVGLAGTTTDFGKKEIDTERTILVVQEGFQLGDLLAEELGSVTNATYNTNTTGIGDCGGKLRTSSDVPASQMKASKKKEKSVSIVGCCQAVGIVRTTYIPASMIGCLIPNCSVSGVLICCAEAMLTMSEYLYDVDEPGDGGAGARRVANHRVSLELLELLLSCHLSLCVTCEVRCFLYDPKGRERLSPFLEFSPVIVFTGSTGCPLRTHRRRKLR